MSNVTHIEFKKSDEFFEQVLAFFTSWLTYSLVGSGDLRRTEISGKLRGFIIPQLKFEKTVVLSNLLDQRPVNSLKFEIDSSDPGAPQGRKVKTEDVMQFWCQQMFGHAYETAYDKIESRYSAEVKKWPVELQFAYHVRNGCFHGNEFYILHGKIDSAKRPFWRGREINYSDNGTKVANQFMGPADFIVLLHDMRTLI